MTTPTNISQQFCVRWNSHLGSLGAAFPQLLAGQRFVDVTLACEGHQVHCHRLVLAACSTYFESLLGENPCKHPIIILPREIKLWEIQALVDFMYKGEVNVSQAGLPDLLKCAETLQIRGLCGSDAALNLNQITNATNGSTTTTTTPAGTTSIIQQHQHQQQHHHQQQQLHPLASLSTAPPLSALTTALPTTATTNILQQNNSQSTILPTLSAATSATPIMTRGRVLNEAAATIAAITTTSHTVHMPTTAAHILQQHNRGPTTIAATITRTEAAPAAVTIKNVLPPPKIVRTELLPVTVMTTPVATTIKTQQQPQQQQQQPQPQQQQQQQQPTIKLQATAALITQSTTPATTTTIAIQPTQLVNCMDDGEDSANGSGSELNIKCEDLDDSDTQMNAADYSDDLDGIDKVQTDNYDDGQSEPPPPPPQPQSPPQSPATIHHHQLLHNISQETNSQQLPEFSIIIDKLDEDGVDDIVDDDDGGKTLSNRTNSTGGKIRVKSNENLFENYKQPTNFKRKLNDSVDVWSAKFPRTIESAETNDVATIFAIDKDHQPMVASPIVPSVSIEPIRSTGGHFVEENNALPPSLKYNKNSMLIYMTKSNNKVEPPASPEPDDFITLANCDENEEDDVDQKEPPPLVEEDENNYEDIICSPNFEEISYMDDCDGDEDEDDDDDEDDFGYEENVEEYGGQMALPASLHRPQQPHYTSPDDPTEMPRLIPFLLLQENYVKPQQKEIRMCEKMHSNGTSGGGIVDDDTPLVSAIIDQRPIAQKKPSKRAKKAAKEQQQRQMLQQQQQHAYQQPQFSAAVQYPMPLSNSALGSGMQSRLQQYTRIYKNCGGSIVDANGNTSNLGQLSSSSLGSAVSGNYVGGVLVSDDGLQSIVPSPSSVVLRNPRGNQPRSYNPDELFNALMDVKAGESIYRASQIHKVPRKTLRNWMKRWDIKSAFPMPRQLKQAAENKKKNKAAAAAAAASTITITDEVAGGPSSSIQKTTKKSELKIDQIIGQWMMNNNNNNNNGSSAATSAASTSTATTNQPLISSYYTTNIRASTSATTKSAKMSKII